MNDKFRQFHDNELNSEELKAFIEEAKAMTDEELDAGLNSIGDIHDDTDLDIDSIYENILSDINSDNSRRYKKYRVYLGIAAAVIPILVIVSIYFFIQSSNYGIYEDIITKEISISTSNGESANATLPDGSTIKLGPASTICYKLSSFNDTIRSINWEGEGLFQIAKISGNPFIISTEFVEITVLGTTFNLHSRNSSDQVEIYLEKGAIKVSVPKYHKDLEMKPGETAFISKLNGEINVYRNDAGHRYSIGPTDIRFESRRFSDIVNAIELYYGKNVIAAPSLDSELFTGPIPTNDLNKSLRIIEKVFHVKTELRGDSIFIK